MKTLICDMNGGSGDHIRLTPLVKEVISIEGNR